MAIKTVTTENLAEYAATRTPPAEVTSAKAVETAVTEGPTPGNPVIKAGEEKTADAPPEPQVDPKPRKGDLQARLEGLLSEKKELDEAFQSEYEMRLRLEGELNALKSQSKPEEPKAKVEEKEDLEPDPEKYTDNKLFLKEWGAWNRRKALAEFAVEQAKIQQEEAMRRANEALATRIAQAKKDIPDFQEVIEAADRVKTVVPDHVKAAIVESELGPQLAYHLAKHPEEQKRIFALPIAKALLELGKIELKYAPKQAAADPAPVDGGAPPIETSKAPAPIAKLKDSPTTVPGDLSGPMPFKDYRQKRVEQIRANRRH
jgi:hypothetical protein